MQKQISPSLICMDLCNLAAEADMLVTLGCKMLHVDIIDGRFSPDMPLGIDTVRQLSAYIRKKQYPICLDGHLMAVDNTSYAEMLCAAGIDRLCVHLEYEPRPTIILRKIRNAGVKPGIAVSPETPFDVIEPLLALCDFVLIMRIDAGYAHLPGQNVYPAVDEKIRMIDQWRKENNPDLEIEADGRIGFYDIVPLSLLGVDTFVSGTRGLFYPECSREENWKKMMSLLGE